MPMAILGWGGGVGNRGDLGDIPNTNEAHINWCSWVRGDGVGEKGGGDMGGGVWGGWGSMQKGEQLQDSHQVYIYVFIFTFIYIRGGWVRAVLNQSTTHCYFGDSRDVHAMGTCSATLNDDR